MEKKEQTNGWVSEDRTAVWIGLAIGAIGILILCISRYFS